MTERRVLMSIVLVCIFLGSIALMLLPYRAVSIDTQRAHEWAYWSEILEKYGHDRAREAYLESTKGFGAGSQHVVAHAFSRALYATYGAQALGMCGTEYVGGCLHEVISQIFRDAADPATIARECAETQVDAQGFIDRACAHGIGHALLKEAGYTREGARTAMLKCEELGLAPTHGACTYGVIMEWYFRYLSEEPVLYPRDDDAEGLCREFTGKGREACFYNIATLWVVDLAGERGSSPEAFAALAERCLALPETHSDREMCVRGVGRVLGMRERLTEEHKHALCASSFTDAAWRELCAETIRYVASIR